MMIYNLKEIAGQNHSIMLWSAALSELENCFRTFKAILKKMWCLKSGRAKFSKIHSYPYWAKSA